MHVVSPGDSLYGVAVHYGVDPRDLIVRRRDFLPFFLSSSSAFFYRLFSPRRLRERERERVFSLHFEFKWNAMTLTTKRDAGETELTLLFSSIANTTHNDNNNRQRTRRRSAGSNTCYRDNDW